MIDDVSAEEMRLQTEFYISLYPVLQGIYEALWDIKAKSANRSEYEKVATERYQRARRFLAAVISLYITTAVELAGSMGLQHLGTPGPFRLQSGDVKQQIARRVDQLTTVGTPISILDTAIDRVWMATGIVGLAGLSASVTSQHEIGWGFSHGLDWMWFYSGLEYSIFKTRGDDKVCYQCFPLEGRRFETGNVPPDLVVPVHVICRCIHLPEMFAWTIVPDPWHGEDRDGRPAFS